MNPPRETQSAVETMSLMTCLERVCQETKTPYKERRVVSDIMTQPVEALTLDHSVKGFLSFMQVHRVRHAPVVDYPQGRHAEPEFIGVISQRDALRLSSWNGAGKLSSEPDSRALRQLLSRVVTRGAHTVEPDVPIGRAVEILLDQHIDMLPVVVNQKAVGIVTTTDLLRMIVRTAEVIEEACVRQTHQKNPTVWAQSEDANRSRLGHFVKQTVEAVMARDLITMSPNHTLGEAIHTIQEHQLRHIPIVDEEGRLVGILSDRDVLRHLPYQSHGLHTPSGKFREDLFRVEEARSALTQRIEGIMTTKLVTIRPDCPVIEAAMILMKKKIGVLPVLDSQDKMVGILSVLDLLGIARSIVE